MILYIFILSAIMNTVANILNIVNFYFMFHADMNSNILSAPIFTCFPFVSESFGLCPVTQVSTPSACSPPPSLPMLDR